MKSPSILRAQALVSFPFFALGLFSVVGLLGWLLVHPEILQEAARSPRPLAFVHLVILGWLLPFVFGAAYQLIPVIAETPLRSRALAYVHFGLHLVAAPRFFAALLAADFASGGRWGAIVAAGALIGVTNLAITAARRSRWSPDNLGLLLATFWLAITVVLGVLLAFARLGAVSDFEPERLLRLHQACGLVGFFLLTLVAVSFKLVPMFLLSPVRTHARAWTSIALLNSGVMLAVPGLLGDWRWVIIASATLVATGVAAYLVEMVVLIARRMRRLDWPLRSFFVGVAMLVPTVALGSTNVAGRLGFEVWQPPAPGAAVFVLGVFGSLSACILGMAGKIVPFLAWQWRYAQHVGRARVPLVTDLFREPLLRAQCFAHVLSAAALLLGAGAGAPVGLRIGTAGVAVAVLLFAVNVVHLVRHVVRPRIEPLPASRTATAHHARA